jgi:hypothetical protein
VEAEGGARVRTKKSEESGAGTGIGAEGGTRRSEGSGAACTVVEDGTGTKINNGGKTNNQEKRTGATGLDQEWMAILRDLAHPPQYPTALGRGDLSWIQEGVIGKNSGTSSTSSSNYNGLKHVRLLRIAKQLSVSDSNRGKDKTESVVNMGNAIGEPHAQSFNVHQLGPATLPESGAIPEVMKTLIQNVKETCDPEIVQVDPAYK